MPIIAIAICLRAAISKLALVAENGEDVVSYTALLEFASMPRAQGDGKPEG